MLPEPSPRGPPEPEQPPQQQAASTMMSSLAAEQEAQSQGPPHSSNRMNYVLFENLPRGISADDDDDDIYNDTNSSSVLTLPNIPSPMTQPSPSLMANNNPNRPKPSTTDYHPSQTPAASFSRGSQSQSRKKNNNDEEDTFYDDRSLEFRIQRTLSHAPQPVHMLNTPASVPVTPGGPLSSSSSNSAHAAPSTVHKTPTFHFQNISDDDNDNHYNNDNMQSHRSATAIMKLKQDLRGAINNLYLYKQEKEAAESRAQELKRQNEQLLSEQKQVQEQAKAMEEERAQMEQTKTELQSYKDQLEKLQEEKNQMAKDMEQLKTAKERAEQENEELATRIRTVLREHQEDLKSFGENTDARVSRLKGELETANQEMETLQNSLAEAKKEATEVAQEREEETNQLKAELLAMTEKRDSCLRELEELKTATQTTSSSEEKPGASDSGSEYQSTTEAIEDSLDMATTLKESKQKLAKTEEEMAQVKSENETQLQEIQRLAAEVGEMKQKASPTHSNATPSNSNLAQKHVAVQTYTASSADLSIQDRLLRIRDASERVALVKEHHNEIARLKAQYESQIKDLTSLHEDTLRERLEEETSKLENQHKDAMERLQSELETKMASMEKRHRLEVERVSLDFVHSVASVLFFKHFLTIVCCCCFSS